MAQRLPSLNQPRVASQTRTPWEETAGLLVEWHMASSILPEPLQIRAAKLFFNLTYVAVAAAWPVFALWVRARSQGELVIDLLADVGAPVLAAVIFYLTTDVLSETRGAMLAVALLFVGATIALVGVLQFSGEASPWWQPFWALAALGAALFTRSRGETWVAERVAASKQHSS